MPRLKQLEPQESDAWTRKLFGKVEGSLGLVPNMFKCMGNSDVALDGFLNFNAGLGGGKLGGKNSKMITLATSELNRCGYCASAHTQMAKNAELLTDEECLNARRGQGTDEKSQAMLDFVKKVHETKGKVSDEDIHSLRQKGFTDGEIVEILGTMVLITFANYVSNVAQPELDFPRAPEIS
jgi:uncharacterized peroxidase-related enzyme